MVWRVCGATVTNRGAEAPSGSRYVTATVAATSLGLASSRNMSNQWPVAPSANAHVADGVVTPAAPCPASKGAVPAAYIARSATIGAVAVMTTDVSAPAGGVVGSISSKLTQIVWRRPASTRWRRTRGGSGKVRMYVIVTSTG